MTTYEGMSMKVAIHQPNYLPYIGFFEKAALSDIFILLDSVQFSKDSYTQRTKIRTRDGWAWCTVPIEKEYDFKHIKEVYLPKDKKWSRKQKLSMAANYSKTSFFDANFIDEFFTKPFQKLQEMNEFGITYLMENFGIRPKIFRSSELGIDPRLRSTDLLIEIIKRVGGNTYISGEGGRNYMDEELFSINGIDIKYFHFRPFIYNQRWTHFEPYMSAIDLLFNLGPSDSRRILQNDGLVEAKTEG